MGNIITYKVDNNSYQVSINKELTKFQFGESFQLSREDTDIVFHQDWYNQGFTTEKFLNEQEFANLKQGLTQSLMQIIQTELNLENRADFCLENYHQFVKNDEDHSKVVAKTRDIFAEDFNFPLDKIIPKFEDILGFELTDVIPINGKQLHVILRINRPKSNDFNPPHKDIYEAVDEANYIAPFVNIWIPIAGVTENSSLPVVARSHLLTEDKILRTNKGAEMEGKQYRVRMIKEWDDSNQMERAKVNYGEALIFSAHLIHGLAVNGESEITRVALEFRLFKSIKIAL